MVPKKIAIYAILSACVGISITLFVLEVIFRVLPTSDSLYMLAVDDQNPIFRARPNRDVILSQGWDFRPVAKKRANNFGFLNDQDYVQSDASPLLAVIGDSYVEAAQVESSKAMHGVLSTNTPHPGRVYSFGVSGAPLSHYLAEASYAVDTFGADFLVFVVIGNDFDESLFKYKQHPGQHYFVERNDGSFELRRVNYSPTRLKRIAQHSAFLRYLFINLRFNSQIIVNWIRSIAPRPDGEFFGNTLAQAEDERIEDSQLAVDEFLRRLQYINVSTDRILILIDGMRPEIYDENRMRRSANSYLSQMRQYLISAAAVRRIETIDMHPVFARDFVQRKIRYEFPTDGHWNETGHATVAQEIASSKVYKKFLADIKFFGK